MDKDKVYTSDQEEELRFIVNHILKTVVQYSLDTVLGIVTREHETQ